jgi:uncharacterized protein
VQRLLQGFPVVTVTGPRQSGKTTLVRALLADRPYVSLETPSEREFANADPLGYLARFPDGAVIDEVQHAPMLLSQIQSVVDADARMGLFVLSGSQNLALLAHVTQSLAGRSALVELLPLSVAELRSVGLLRSSAAEQMLWGFYPALYSRDVQPADWLQNYLLTYVERDARQLSAIQDLAAFQRLLGLAAARTGQLLNIASLASDAGVSESTARQWLSILETCYLIHYVRPHSRNFGKRLVKSAKLYFTDVGLASALLGIQTAAQLALHPLRGALFETLVVNEFLKARRNAGSREQLWFWRDNIGTEVDLVLERGMELAAVEIKSGPTISEDAFRNLRKWRHYAGHEALTNLGLVYGGDEAFERSGVSVKPWKLL